MAKEWSPRPHWQVDAGGDAADQGLLQSVRMGLQSEDPLDFLTIVSGFLEVTDPRSADPFPPDTARVDLFDVVESFIQAPYMETTAVLTGICALTPDEELAARIRRELAERRHPLPGWLIGLDRAEIDRSVWLLTHVLGDGDDYLFGVTMPSGHAVSVLVYVDHNLGSVVKDAYVVSEHLEDLAIQMGTLLDDPDQSLTRTGAATARAVVEAAIRKDARRHLPLMTRTWPVCRPLVEWMLRMLPADGEAPRKRGWTEENKAELTRDFFASPYGAPFVVDDVRDLFQGLVWFGTSYATADPLNWSTVTVEMILADWFPRKVIAAPAYTAQLPDLLRAYIRYAHNRRGIRPSLTQEVLDAVDIYEPVYLELIDRDDQQLAEFAGTLLEAHRLESMDPEEYRLELLAGEVGGEEVLASLDDLPLPDEEFDWTGVPDDIRATVQRILDECDGCAEAMLDVEHRTAMRRFLAAAARNDPAVFRRRGSPRRGAAAVAWAIANVNGTLNPYNPAMTSKALLAHFGVGPVSDRARALIQASGTGMEPTFGYRRVGDLNLIVSRRRRELIELRDECTSRPR